MVALGNETHRKNRRHGDVRGANAPAALITSSVRFVINLPALYSYGFDRYDIAEYTRIERNDLIAAGKQIRDYFNNDERGPDNPHLCGRGAGGIAVQRARDPPHADVKALVRGVYLVQMLALLYIAAYIAARFSGCGAPNSGGRWGAM